MAGLADIAGQVMEVFNRIQEAIRARYVRQIAPYKLTVTQFKALQHLHWHGEGLSIGELSGHLGLTSSTVSGIVDRLQRNGWIERRRDPRDRRRVTVKLTPKGEELFKQKPRSTEDFWRETIARLDEEERVSLLKILSRLKGVMENPEWPSYQETHPSPDETMNEILRDIMNWETSRVGMLLFIARLADEEGKGEIAAYLKQMSYEELNHAVRISKFIGEMRTLRESLEGFLEDERRSHMMKIDAAQFAEKSGEREIAEILRKIGEDERRHRRWIYSLLNRIRTAEDRKAYAE
ncbi:TPA: MarR family transcriptional regulator [Candidatus Poribacteria bacterium]|nr:MarR family transcriptional regulator [Candidatus Poribacteria bacterium]